MHEIIKKPLNTCSTMYELESVYFTPQYTSYLRATTLQIHKIKITRSLHISHQMNRYSFSATMLNIRYHTINSRNSFILLALSNDLLFFSYHLFSWLYLSCYWKYSKQFCFIGYTISDDMHSLLILKQEKKRIKFQ